MDKPKTIFKYESFNMNSIVNLNNRVIYFSSPYKFNDPYDCAITAPIKELNDKEVIAIRDVIIKDFDLLDTMKKVLNGTEVSVFRKFVIQLTETLVSDNNEKFLNDIGVSCFSEKNDNLLMWSHYADSCAGFCLELDTRADLFSKIRKVTYEDKIPSIDPVRMFVKNDYKQQFELYCQKSKSWEYEEEWRCFHAKAGTKFVYDSSVLKAVYFGPEIKPDKAELLGLIVKSQHPKVKLFQGERRTDRFGVKFSEVVSE